MTSSTHSPATHPGPLVQLIRSSREANCESALLQIRTFFRYLAQPQDQKLLHFWNGAWLPLREEDAGHLAQAIAGQLAQAKANAPRTHRGKRASPVEIAGPYLFDPEIPGHCIRTVFIATKGRVSGAEPLDRRPDLRRALELTDGQGWLVTREVARLTRNLDVAEYLESLIFAKRLRVLTLHRKEAEAPEGLTPHFCRSCMDSIRRSYRRTSDPGRKEKLSQQIARAGEGLRQLGVQSVGSPSAELKRYRDPGSSKTFEGYGRPSVTTEELPVRLRLAGDPTSLAAPIREPDPAPTPTAARKAPQKQRGRGRPTGHPIDEHRENLKQVARSLPSVLGLHRYVTRELGIPVSIATLTKRVKAWGITLQPKSRRAE